VTTVERYANVDLAAGDLMVGVDIGGTNSTVGIVDAEGTILLQARFPTRAQEPAGEYVVRLVRVIHELRDQLPQGTTAQGIAIAIPAANSREGVVENPANFNWGRVDLVGLMKRAIDLPVSIINDGDAAVLGEIRYGAARGMKSVLMITLGTGLGAGIVVHGKLVQGHNGAAGEFGHMALVPEGRQCACGRRGCVETYVSAPGLRRTVFELLAERIDESGLRQIAFTDLTAETVARLARDGDAIAKAAFEITGTYLGQMLANLVAAFDPEAIVLCGGLVNAGDLLVAPARQSLSDHVLERSKESVKLLVSNLNNGQAAILGASWLARDTPQSVEKT
jgi:glucokinase